MTTDLCMILLAGILVFRDLIVFLTPQLYCRRHGKIPCNARILLPMKTFYGLAHGPFHLR